MKNKAVFKMKMTKIYPLLLKKVEKKGRSKEELDKIIMWLTGYDEKGLEMQIQGDVDMETFFLEAPQMNPNSSKITGVICGVRVEEVQDPLMKKIRMLDKLVDELAKGKSMEKILRD